MLPVQKKIINQSEWPKILLMGKSCLIDKPYLQQTFTLPAAIANLYPNATYASIVTYNHPTSHLTPIKWPENILVTKKSLKRALVPSNEDLKQREEFRKRSKPEEAELLERKEEIISEHHQNLKSIEIYEKELQIIEVKKVHLEKKVEKPTKHSHNIMYEYGQVDSKLGKLKVV